MKKQVFPQLDQKVYISFSSLKDYLNPGQVMQNVRVTKALTKVALVQAIHNASRC